MNLTKEPFLLPDGRTIELRSPLADDAAAMLDYLSRTSEQTHFMIRYADELTMTTEQEREFLQTVLESENSLFLAAFLDGAVVGNVSVQQIGAQRKLRHRAELGIALCREVWDVGLGTRLMRCALDWAKSVGFSQIELGVFADNVRAVHLYSKLGFRQTGIIPRAFRLDDGTFRDETQMMLSL